MESKIWNSLMKFDTRLNQVEETESVFSKVGGAFKSIGNIVQTETFFVVKPEHKDEDKVSNLLNISSDETIYLLSVSDRIGKYDSYFVVTNRYLYLNSYLKEDDYISLQLPLGLIEGAVPGTDGINVSIKSSETNLKLKSNHLVNECIGDTVEIIRLISELINELKNEVEYNDGNIFTAPITDETLEEFKSIFLPEFGFKNWKKEIKNNQSLFFNDDLDIDPSWFSKSQISPLVQPLLEKISAVKFETLLKVNEFQLAQSYKNGIKDFGKSFTSLSNEFEKLFQDVLENGFSSIKNNKVLLVPEKAPDVKLSTSLPLELEFVPKHLKFPPTHPKKGEVYVKHPIDGTTYLPIESHDDFLFEQKTNEFLRLLRSLGARQIDYKITSNSSVSSSLEFNQSGNSFLGFAKIGANKSVSHQHNKNESKDDAVSKSYQLKYAPEAKPHVPNDMLWLDFEPEWQRIVDDRLNHNLLESNTSYSKKQNQVIDTKLIQDIEAEINPLKLPIGASLKLAKKKYEKSNAETEIVVTVHCQFEDVKKLSNE